jgi:hypothetical protein
MNQIVLGWREWVGLPDLGVDVIAAKVDSGAKSSSIDVSQIEPYVTEEGEHRVRFVVHPERRVTVDADAPVADLRTIRNPGRGGREEERFVIRTDLAIAGSRWPIEVTLARRTRMQYRMLIGREAIAGVCLIDPNSSYLLGGRP